MSREVFGLSCEHALLEHRDAVTSLAVITSYRFAQARRNITVLVTSSWDKRICIWNLETGILVDVAKDVYCPKWDEREFMANDVILDLKYSLERDEIAYVSADWYLYLRNFNLDGRKMRLKKKLEGHHGEVTCLCWRPPLKEDEHYTSIYMTNPSPFDVNGSWITGSVDGTIRAWYLDESLGQNDHVLINAGNPITCLIWDSISRLVVAGVAKDLKTFDLESKTICHHFKGHYDIIRDVIRTPCSNEYLTASSDGRIRIWKANSASIFGGAGVNLTGRLSLNEWSQVQDLDEEASFVAAKDAEQIYSLNPRAALTAAAHAFRYVNGLITSRQES